MHILVLGSAAGGGFPQWNCSCTNCRRARLGDPAAVPRTQSSLAVSADGRLWFLLNASPDIRLQIERTPALQPRGAEQRASPIGGVVLTNADVDHVAGLLSLRERHRLTIYASARVLQALAANPIFDVLDRKVVLRRTLPLDCETSLEAPDGSGCALAVTSFAVPGKVALWLEGVHQDPGGMPGDTLGLKVTDQTSGACFFYVPACAEMTAGLEERLASAPLVFFDGTTWTDDEMPSLGVGSKTAARMGHLSMSGPGGSLAAFETLGIGRKIFIHVNNTNPVLLACSPERRQAEAAGWEIAEDGLEIVL